MKRDSTNAPDNFIFAGSGDGGVAEIIKVSADFGLNADSTNTVLRSIIEAEMGGKFVQLGSRPYHQQSQNLLKIFKKL